MHCRMQDEGHDVSGRAEQESQIQKSVFCFACKTSWVRFATVAYLTVFERPPNCKHAFSEEKMPIV